MALLFVDYSMHLHIEVFQNHPFYYPGFLLHHYSARHHNLTIIDALAYRRALLRSVIIVPTINCTPFCGEFPVESKSASKFHVWQTVHKIRVFEPTTTISVNEISSFRSRAMRVNPVTRFRAFVIACCHWQYARRL